MIIDKIKNMCMIIFGKSEITFNPKILNTTYYMAWIIFFSSLLGLIGFGIHYWYKGDFLISICDFFKFYSGPIKWATTSLALFAFSITIKRVIQTEIQIKTGEQQIHDTLDQNKFTNYFKYKEYFNDWFESTNLGRIYMMNENIYFKPIQEIGEIYSDFFGRDYMEFNIKIKKEQYDKISKFIEKVEKSKIAEDYNPSLSTKELKTIYIFLNEIGCEKLRKLIEITAKYLIDKIDFSSEDRLAVSIFRTPNEKEEFYLYISILISYCFSIDMLNFSGVNKSKDDIIEVNYGNLLKKAGINKKDYEKTTKSE